MTYATKITTELYPYGILGIKIVFVIAITQLLLRTLVLKHRNFNIAFVFFFVTFPMSSLFPYCSGSQKNISCKEKKFAVGRKSHHNIAHFFFSAPKKKEKILPRDRKWKKGKILVVTDPGKKRKFLITIFSCKIKKKRKNTEIQNERLAF